MVLSWMVLVISSVFFGIAVTLVIQFYFLRLYFYHQDHVITQNKIITEPFQLPKVLLDAIRTDQSTTKENCTALNLLLQFLFHELRDTEKIRRWFRNKLTLEFEELIARSTIGRMLASIKVRDISLGSEFPIINNIVVQNVKVNNDYSHIDTLDLKLDLSYLGGFQLMVDANMLLGKTAYVSIKVNELYGEGRLQFTRLPYSHWSFTFYNEPKLQLQVESQFQGRPLPQITNLIASQIRKSLRKKHTLPNFKMRYKPFFNVSEDSSSVTNISPGQMQLILHRISRLNEVAAPLNREIYCLAGLDIFPWIEITNYGKVNYYVLDLLITKKMSQKLGFVFKQELVEERNQSCIILEKLPSETGTGSSEVYNGDIAISVDGKRITTVNQGPKFIKSAAIQFTLRVERRVPNQLLEDDCPAATTEPLPIRPPSTLGVLRKRKNSESDSSNSSPPASMPGSPGKKAGSGTGSPEHKKVAPLDFSHERSRFSVRLVKTKPLLNNQVIVYDELFNLNVGQEDKYLNINVRARESNVDKDILLGYVNVPLSTVINSNDSLKSFQLKPPDSFLASNSRGHKLSCQNGFIPLLCYGDILVSLHHALATAPAPSPIPKCEVFDINKASESSSASSSRPASGERKHDFVRTHFQTSTQCGFCGKKIWLKDAERCRQCGMTCHKKCVAKCKASTVCSLCPGSNVSSMISSTTAVASLIDVGGRNSSTEDADASVRRPSIQPEIITTSVEEPRQSQPTPKKGLGSLLASVASAGRGLKRVGSAHSLALPGSQSPSLQSRSLPPSPQQTPASSRKPSLPMELSEDITSLLQTLLREGSDQGDMLGFAKETGKTLFEDLELPERKEKIHEMITKLRFAIDSETDLRFSLDREEQTSKDPTQKTKTAFLIGKSDEKCEALTLLMLHFCAGLQHIQDLEEQERESLIVTD